MKFLGLALLLAVASARPQREAYPEEIRSNPSNREQIPDDRRGTTTVIPIIQWNKQQDIDGTYKTNYETGNNIAAEESGYIKTIQDSEGKDVPSLVQRGSYSYTSPNGEVITTHWVADEMGFQVSGEHLPTAPPVSEEIQKGLDLIYEGIRLQEEAAAREEKLGPQPAAQSLQRQDEKDRIYQQRQ